MRVLITGSRDWTDYPRIERILSDFPENTTIIHGGARGADALAGQAAMALGFEVEVYPAEWDRYGNRAGTMRNQLMVDTKPDLCIAFPLEHSRGTFDCIRRAEAAGIMVIRGDELVAPSLPTSESLARDRDRY